MRPSQLVFDVADSVERMGHVEIATAIQRPPVRPEDAEIVMSHDPLNETSWRSVLNRGNSDSAVLLADAHDLLKTIPDGIFQTTITSPPYWSLRDYGIEGQIGAEISIEDYIENLVLLFEEVRRVTRDDGTLWLNLG